MPVASTSTPARIHHEDAHRGSATAARSGQGRGAPLQLRMTRPVTRSTSRVACRCARHLRDRVGGAALERSDTGQLAEPQDASARARACELVPRLVRQNTLGDLPASAFILAPWQPQRLGHARSAPMAACRVRRRGPRNRGTCRATPPRGWQDDRGALCRTARWPVGRRPPWTSLALRRQPHGANAPRSAWSPMRTPLTVGPRRRPARRQANLSGRRR
jgi:hypothetical protein